MGLGHRPYIGSWHLGAQKLVQHTPDVWVCPRGGNALYLWLRANQFTTGFRVLCQNCNFALGLFGSCSHGDLVQPLPTKKVTAQTLKTRAYQRDRNLSFKMRAFAAYRGSKCACCGEDHLECLTMDHRNNDGAQHRKILSGKPIYRWLCENGFPEGFQVLYMNCNTSKRDNSGVCQHKLGVSNGA